MVLVAGTVGAALPDMVLMLDSESCLLDVERSDSCRSSSSLPCSSSCSKIISSAEISASTCWKLKGDPDSGRLGGESGFTVVVACFQDLLLLMNLSSN